MKKPVKTIVLFLLLSTLLLAACTSSIESTAEAPASLPVEETAEIPAETAPSAALEDTVSKRPTVSGEKKILITGSLTQKDDQGAVTVVVTPLELMQVDDTLEFDVAMDTHSVDLSMDLSVLATLTTDTGKSITPSQWDAPMGGHHVSGKLVFPAVLDDAPLLEGAAAITLILRDIDAAEREFIWPITIE